MSKAADDALARKVIKAALIESAWLMLVIGAFLLTENIWLLIGGVVLGAVPLSIYVIRVSKSAAQSAETSSIVEGGRR